MKHKLIIAATAATLGLGSGLAAHAKTSAANGALVDLAEAKETPK